MTTARDWASYLILSMTAGIIFQVAYIRFVFLEPTYTALGLTGQEYGNVMAVFGAVAAVMYFFGGWFADRFSPRSLIVVALVGTGAADLYLTTSPGYAGVLAAHVVMAVMGMALYWSALVKAIGMLGSASVQGRLFGFLEAVRGVTSTLIGAVGAMLVANAVVPSAGVLGLIRVYGVLCLVFAVLVWSVVRVDRDRLAELGTSTVTLRQLLEAARNPYTWLLGVSIMLMYSFYTTLGYFSPLLQNEFGMAAGLIGAIGVARTYVFQFIGGPLGGLCVDKITRSTAGFLRWTFLGAAAIAGVFLLLPRESGLKWVALGLMFALCLMVFMSRGVYWAGVAEAGIPERHRGGVIGLASGLAYLPDAFLPPLAAWWTGDPASGIPQQGGGYDALFAFLLAAGLLGAVLTTVIVRSQRRAPRGRRPELAPAA
ncbi:MFS transporter [Saccharopolyspora erythraea]|uniref:MFS transporter n=1 Tax=Saccharopolyspora erythraea TaxID=1836 RepID=UPI001BA86563|nr:MFS transporter [Saccharopolyspora erythraea]QUH03860.1 MFS transporter [Saccharopolyspora erythraea]